MVSEKPNVAHYDNDPTLDPVDRKLRRLGQYFYAAVKRDDFKRALELRRQILDRKVS